MLAAIGLPVLVADVPPVREVFGAWPGARFCAPGSAASIADGVKSLATSPRGSRAVLPISSGEELARTALASVFHSLTEDEPPRGGTLAGG